MSLGGEYRQTKEKTNKIIKRQYLTHGAHAEDAICVVKHGEKRTQRLDPMACPT